MAARQIVIPYSPREAFRPFHDRKHRWACLVVHRRGGKTVAAINDLIRAAITCKSPNPHFAYIAPFRSQAKSVAWSYLKHYSAPIASAVNEAELTVTLINGARISLFGADNADAMRGLGFDGVLLDEYGDFRPSVWGLVIRPTLADRQGWAVFMGTPKGKNQFWDIYDMARNRPDEWFCMRLPASISGILPQSELDALKIQSTDDQYQQEMECSFEAAILGAFYGIEMRQLVEAGRMCCVPYDESLTTFSAWDIGHSDDTSIWWWQMLGAEVRIIDFYTVSGSGVEDVGKLVASKPYHYERHFLPHDARAKTFASNGKSTIEQLISILGFSTLSIVPMLSVQDGIQATRKMLPQCWFDEEKCHDGIEALKQYEREWDDDNKCFRMTPKHNWASNPADAARMMAISYRNGGAKPISNPDRALIVGPGNKSTLEDAWAASKRFKRTARI